MSSWDQVPYSEHDAEIFVNNPDPRCPCILLLDKSASMGGDPITELNAGIRTLKNELSADDIASRRVELAILSFGPITKDVGFSCVADFDPPELVAGSDTPMGRAIEEALDMVETRKQTYKAHGIAYYRPWILLITDGAPTDNWQKAAKRVHEAEKDMKVVFFAVGVGGADFEVLRRISVREPLRLAGLQFSELFKWLSASMQVVSQSQLGTRVKLPPPGWAEV